MEDGRHSPLVGCSGLARFILLEPKGDTLPLGCVLCHRRLFFRIANSLTIAFCTDPGIHPVIRSSVFINSCNQPNHLYDWSAGKISIPVRYLYGTIHDLRLVWKVQPTQQTQPFSFASFFFFFFPNSLGLGNPTNPVWFAIFQNRS
ncbi:hypothetical protein HanXRQr2_Chr03g0108611 [Helianthus annuus]|uniref:Uncharacterized protein n=1 Tax=Helianthus annuus TaxID=4232 RepID=A0A9K3NVK5_HELAN|nr:hypothetical protein HanXRQr2_Chr03g0108611 [Helianthus annuus]